jgi:hypothetical protein
LVDARNRALIADDGDLNEEKMGSKLTRSREKQSDTVKSKTIEMTFGNGRPLAETKTSTAHNALKNRIEKLEKLVYDNLDASKKVTTF